MLRIAVPFSSNREPSEPSKFPTAQNPFWPTLARFFAWFMAIICAIWTLTSAYHASIYHFSKSWPTATARLVSTQTREVKTSSGDPGRWGRGVGASPGITLIERTNLYAYEVNGRKFNVKTKDGSFPGVASFTPREIAVRYWPAFPSTFILERNRQETDWSAFTGPAVTALLATGLFAISARAKPSRNDRQKKMRRKKKTK